MVQENKKLKIWQARGTRRKEYYIGNRKGRNQFLSILPHSQYYKHVHSINPHGQSRYFQTVKVLLELKKESAFAHNLADHELYIHIGNIFGIPVNYILFPMLALYSPTFKAPATVFKRLNQF